MSYAWVAGAPIEFEVPGEPVPQGSMICTCVNGRGMMRPGNKTRLMRYRRAIHEAAGEACDRVLRGQTFPGPVALELVFYLSRPKDQWSATGGLKPWAPSFHSKRNNDVDKLCRAVLDGLTGSIVGDDGQVAQMVASKFYEAGGAERGGPRTLVRIRPLEDGGRSG